ncbi:MAG: Gfo/Idh/MocA family oxidoreductase [Chloroflexi bacterium]|nr:Gfo/Idh/MocA family oxidoreductase [Chloroflexota bacterium]
MRYRSDARSGGAKASKSIDLVSIASPPEFHERMARQTIEAGFHVLCEKPLALSGAGAHDLLRCAQARGIVHAVDFEMRYLPAVAYAKELIEEDYIGSFLRADVTMVMERPWGEHGNWAAEDARGGGLLMELGAHFIDVALWWFGAIARVAAVRRTHFPTVRVSKSGGAKTNGFENRPVTADDAFWCALEFEGGGEALLNFVTGGRHDPGWTISAYGQRGTLIVNSGQLMGMRDGDREMAILPIPKRLELGSSPQDPLMWGMARLAERMVARIDNSSDTSMVPDFGDGAAVADVIDSIRRASHQRAWVVV